MPPAQPSVTSPATYSSTPQIASRASPSLGARTRTTPPCMSSAGSATPNSSNPTVRGPKPYLCSAQIAKIDSRIACE